MKYVVVHEGREIVLELAPRGDGRFDVEVFGRRLVADLRHAGGTGLYSLLLDRDAFEVAAVPLDGGYRIALRGREMVFGVESQQEHDARLVGGGPAQHGPQTIRSVMPGFVTRILVRPGEEVVAGTPLLILEAMKMENEIRSPTAGVVSKLLVKERQTVNGGDALVVIG